MDFISEIKELALHKKPHTTFQWPRVMVEWHEMTTQNENYQQTNRPALAGHQKRKR